MTKLQWRRNRSAEVVLLALTLWLSGCVNLLVHSPWQAELQKIFKTVDFIAIPTLQTLTPASPPLGSTAVFEAQMLSIQNTVPVNLAGNPALAVPIPIEERAVPLTSLELIGPPLSEAGLLNAGRSVERGVNSSIDRPLVTKSSKP